MIHDITALLERRSRACSVEVATASGGPYSIRIHTAPLPLPLGPRVCRYWRNDCLRAICFDPGLCVRFGHAFELYWCWILRGAGADNFRVVVPVNAKVYLIAVIDPLAHFYGISAYIAVGAALAIPPVVARFPGERRCRGEG